MIENYLGIFEESLHKKLEILDAIAKYNNDQEQLLRQENISLDQLDANMEQKDSLIQKLSGLDEGFETLYERIKDQLADNKSSYRDQIRRLQELISLTMEKSISIQAQEARNKKLIEKYFAHEKNQLREGRKASKAAYGYYKSMSNSNVVSAHYLDSKK